MDWELVYYMTSLSISIVVSLGAARYAWRRRSIPGAEYFALFMLGAVLWAFGTILRAVSTSPVLEILGSAVAVIGISIMPVAWLAFTLKYTGRGKWLTTRVWILVTVALIIGFLPAAGYAFYEAFQQERGLDVGDPSPLLTIPFLVAAVFLSLSLLTGTLLIIQALIRAPKMYRRRYYSLLIGVWGPWIFGLPSLWGMEQSLLPLGAAIGGLVATWGVFRYQVFDVMPIAVDTVIESINVGVIVLDTQDRVVDLNPAAQSILKLSAKRATGLPITQALGDWKELIRRLDHEHTQAATDLQAPLCSHRDASQGTAIPGQDGDFYELCISPLYDRQETLSGRLILLQDITARVCADEELQRISDERARRNRELTLLNRVIAATTSRLEATAVLEAVCRELTLAFDLPHAAVAILNDARTALTVVAESRAFAGVQRDAHSEGSVAPSEERPSSLGAVIPVEDNPATKYVLEQRAPLAVVDAQHDPRMAPVHELMRQFGITSLLLLPLIVRDEVVGTIGLDAYERREFSDEEITLAASATAAAAQALEQARAEEALRESEELFRTIGTSAQDALIVIDDEGYITYWNKAAAEMFRYEEAEVLGKELHTLLGPPKYHQEYREGFRRFRETGDGPVVGRTVELSALRKNGQEFPISLSLSSMRLQGRWHAIGIVRDITERKLAEEQLRQAKEAAEEAKMAAEKANRAKSVFLANMSHELRTPLNAILGFAQLMTRDPGLTGEQRENLETIGRSGEHLQGLINDVLELSKIEAGRVALHKECFDLHRLLDGLEEMFHLRAREKDLMLILDRAPDVPQFVRADEGKLRQVLMNLLGNAVKFTQEGGVTLRVGCTPSVSSAIGGEALKGLRLFFEVEDTGPGIEPDELDAVFDPFKQTKSGQMSQEGTGLGMPISRQFVRLMGGDLTLSSELGVGTLFKFDVQIELADAADVPTSHPKRRVIGLEPDQPVYRLLVVEDREANRKLLVKLLAPLGFEMQEAVNGQQGIEVWERWQPHLIWMDMRMPVMDGYEATQSIKCTTQGQATVVVALTASAFESDRAMILSGGCDDFVRKPFREEEIFDILTKHLGVRFVYEESVQPLGVPTEATEGLLTPEALAALPAGWVTNLHQAAIQLDSDLILDLLDQIREGNAPLADALERLAHDFRFDTILALTEPVEDKDE